jgi:hypothetical protein
VASSLPKTCSAIELRGHALRKRDSDAHFMASKGQRAAVTPFPIESRPPVPTRAACCTRAGPQPCATARHRRKQWRSLPLHGPTRARACAGARCPRWDSDPHCPAPHAGASCQLGYEDSEPPPGADPGLLPYGSRAAAVRGGVAGESGFEPELNGPEPIVLPGYTIPHGCGRRDSDPHGPHGPPSLEPGVVTVTPLPPGRPNTPCVRRERLERSPRRLRVCCSGHLS